MYIYIYILHIYQYSAEYFCIFLHLFDRFVLNFTMYISYVSLGLPMLNMSLQQIYGTQEIWLIWLSSNMDITVLEWHHMSVMAFHITSNHTVNSTAYSVNNQSSTSLACCQGNPLVTKPSKKTSNSLHKGPEMQKTWPWHDWTCDF